MAQEISNAYYYVPQDKDDQDIPNAFCIPLKQDEIRLAHIKKYFPLAGEYIFRFKYKYNNQIVWMDVPENSKKLPIFEGRIFLKATRISWISSQSNSNQANNNLSNISSNNNNSSISQAIPTASMKQPQSQQQLNQPQAQQYPQQQQPLPAPAQKNTIDLFSDEDFSNNISTINKQSSNPTNNPSIYNNSQNIPNLLDF